MDSHAKCAACGRRRPLDELIVFGPRDRPEAARHVCRPTLVLAGAWGEPCFRAVVGSADTDTIALAGRPSGTAEVRA